MKIKAILAALLALMMVFPAAQASVQVGQNYRVLNGTIDVYFNVDNLETNKLHTLYEGALFEVIGVAGEWIDVYYYKSGNLYSGWINAYNINKVSEEVDILTYMRQNPFAYWAKANGAVLYDRYREGIYLYIDPAECFLVTKESAEWLDVIYMCQGGINFWGKIKPDNVRRINDISDCVAVVNNPNPADRLYLRTKPERNVVSKGKYYNGTLVHVTENKNGWAKVYICGEKGYMQSKYLAFGEEVLKLGQKPPIVTVSNSSGIDATVRDCPLNTGSNLGRYPNGTRFIAMGLTCEWATVQTMDGLYTGYILLSYLSPELKYDK